MKKKRRSREFKNNSKVIDMEDARKKRQEKRQKQKEAEEQKQTQADERKTRRMRALKTKQSRRRMITLGIACALIVVMIFSLAGIVKLKAKEHEMLKKQEQLQQEKEDLLKLLHRAITKDVFLKEKNIELNETSALLRYSGGDARKLLNILELVVESYSNTSNISETGKTSIAITDEMVEKCLQQNPLAYDKDGEMHYDIISAFIKSIRGSDPDAALYWMARMIEGGEDPQFIARRMVISASEDIGLANPNALLLANAAFDTVMKIGWPEARIALAECCVYLATSPKSNSAYLGIDKALELVRQTGNQPVPLPLRNAPTKLMKELGYHDGYKYPHDYPGHFTPQQYMPDALQNERLWFAQHSPAEEKLYERMVNYWGEKFKKQPPHML